MYFLGQMCCFQRSDVLSRPVEEHHSCMSLQCHSTYTIGLEKQPCMAFIAEYIFGTAGRESDIQFLWLTMSTASHLDCAGTVLLPVQLWVPCWNSWWAKATALGMSVQHLNACTSLGRGQRCCEVKTCALKICSPNEQNVPAVIWKEAEQV